MRLLDQAIERTVRLSSARVGIALVYHTVAPQSGDPQRELVAAHGAALFEAQLRFLRDRYRPVRASELREAAIERRRGAPIPVAITFDDDSPSHVEMAAPALRALGLTGTFFLCGASLDRPFAFWWERLQRAWNAGVDELAQLACLPDAHPTIHDLGRAFERMQPEARDRASERLVELAGPDPPDAGLRRRQVAELGQGGLEIGFHTLRHDVLTALTDPELAGAFVSGRAALADAAGAEPTVAAYPHGRADARVARAAGAAGFSSGFVADPKPIRPASDPFLLGRVVPSPDSVRRLAEQISRALMRGFLRS